VAVSGYELLLDGVPSRWNNFVCRHDSDICVWIVWWIYCESCVRTWSFFSGSVLCHIPFPNSVPFDRFHSVASHGWDMFSLSSSTTGGGGGLWLFFGCKAAETWRGNLSSSFYVVIIKQYYIMRGVFITECIFNLYLQIGTCRGGCITYMCIRRELKVIPLSPLV
jgi:hypothetical protein